MKRVIHSAVLLTALTAIGSALALWKVGTVEASQAAAAAQPEPAESVVAVAATVREHRHHTTTIGTVLALRSVTLRNELAGTVRQVNLQPGAIVEAGSVLVALDTSVEQAELQAQRAQLALAGTTLERLEKLRAVNATSEIEVDKARAERDVAAAQITRTEAVIARKTLRVPFRARVGLADVHPGQYLNEGTEITTLQSVDEALHVDFAVPQAVAALLKPGDRVEVITGANVDGPASETSAGSMFNAKVAAVDARVDSGTRNSTVRARLETTRVTSGGGSQVRLGVSGSSAGIASTALPAPGSSVRVSVGVGIPSQAVAIPASAVRKGPGGDHVFVLAAGADQKLRAQQRSVQLGAALGDQVLVLRGLAAGEQVAASGSFKLRDAALVAVTNATRTTQATPSTTATPATPAPTATPAPAAQDAATKTSARAVAATGS